MTVTIGTKVAIRQRTRLGDTLAQGEIAEVEMKMPGRSATNRIRVMRGGLWYRPVTDDGPETYWVLDKRAADTTRIYLWNDQHTEELVHKEETKLRDSTVAGIIDDLRRFCRMPYMPDTLDKLAAVRDAVTKAMAVSSSAIHEEAAGRIEYTPECQVGIVGKK